MKFTYRWLQDFIDLPAAFKPKAEEGPHGLAHALTMAGLEVDSLKPCGQDSKVLVALVKEVRPHPRSDHLSLCKVDCGGEQLQVVCGAPNVRAGIKAPLAKAGTVLPSGIELKAAAIRGELSQGMLCSEQELGLSRDHEGIMILPDNARVGQQVFSYLGLEDWVFEVGVTPNRGDCLGIRGIARELGALTRGKLKLPPASSPARAAGVGRRMQIRIQDAKLCPRYSARVVTDLTLAPSPAWMRLRLEACGIRSINSIVDVTNYVMLETGQPLHAFDLERLHSGSIVVRPADAPMKFKSLDSVERELVPGDLLICDGEVPVALAGIMGGANSEVGPQTRSVLLESAHFDPLTIRRTAKRLGLHSEASHRFERRVDPEGTMDALNRAVYLLQEIGGGNAAGKALDKHPRRFKPAAVILRDERVRKILGLELSRGSIEKHLKSLGIKIQSRSKQSLKVLSPSYRSDLGREADLIEELVRLHGYDKIPATLPRVSPGRGFADPYLRWSRRLRSYLAGEGLVEAVNVPFTSTEMNRQFTGLWTGEPGAVSILNPIKQENSQMRLSLVPGLVENLVAHTERRVQGFRAFELGKAFCLDPRGLCVESTHLAALLFGPREHRGLRSSPIKLTFLEVKGLVEGIAEITGMDRGMTWSSDDPPPFLHPGKAAAFQHKGLKKGYLGEIHPDLCATLAVPQFLIFELDFAGLVQYAPFDFAVHTLPRFPPVERDLAVVVDEGFPAQQIISWINGFGNPLIEDVRIFDQYSGAPIPQGKKSLAYSVSYRAQDRTLTDDEVNKIHQELTDGMCQRFGTTLRA